MNMSAEINSGQMPREESFDLKEKSDLGMLFDVPMTVKVELGQTTLTLSEILKLAQGSVIEIEKLAGEPLDIFINDNEAAKGEVVVVNDSYGVRMTDIIANEGMDDY